uniref:Shugoshin_C domain-containing protein n=1 Tax=Caenorhabditis tropicalis TaxID=1561998 RepID=A0A1I7UVA7_9PELO
MEIPEMYNEIDGEIDNNSIYGSFHREYPTFIPEETTYRSQKNATEKSIIFPQRLDLSTMHSPSRKGSRKKPSPIKKSGDSRLHETFNVSEKSSKKHYEPVDLDALQKSFETMASEYLEHSMRKNSGSSVTSDRASSVSSSSSGLSQQSLFMQVFRAKELINNKKKIEEKRALPKRTEPTTRTEKEPRRDVINITDSDFHLTSDSYDEEADDTRPPSSQPSLIFEDVEQPRHAPLTETHSNLISSETGRKTTLKEYSAPKTSSGSKKSSVKFNRNAGTMSETIQLSDSKLAELYEKRAPKNTKSQYSDEDVTLTEGSSIMNKTIVDEVFGEFRTKSIGGETPILRTLGGNCSGISLGSNQIERARDATHRSASMTNIPQRKPANRDVFDGCTPGALRHSASATIVSPKKMRELRANRTCPNLPPELARFVIKPSTREIFPLQLDIDAISGKGLRKDEKSTQMHFGGKTVASQIHGDKPSPRLATIPKKSSGADRPTTASNAKKVVNFQSKPFHLVPKTFKTRPPAAYFKTPKVKNKDTLAKLNWFAAQKRHGA